MFRMTKLFGAIALVFLASAFSFATVTVSGTLVNPATGLVSSRAKVRFVIHCNGAQPVVTGTGIIIPGFAELTPDASGAISGSLYSSATEISCGQGNAAGTGWYGVIPYYDGKPGPEVSYTISGASWNYNSATPNTIAPTVTAPTGDSTYCRIDAGNCGFTGTVSPSPDNTRDLGSVGASWRTGYFKTSIVFLGTTISTKTGSGAMVLGTSPALTTPDVGVATGTSLNLGSTGVLSTTAQSGTGSICMTTNCALTTPTISLGSSSVLPWNSDTGLSRGAAGEVDCGNGTATNKTCVFKAGTVSVQSSPSGVAGQAVYGYSSAVNQAVYSENGGALAPVGMSYFGTISGTLGSSNTLGFFPLGEISALTTTAYAGANGEMPVTYSHTVGGVNVKCGSAGTSASSGVVTVMKSNSATSITCTIGTGTSCSDFTHPTAFSAGQTIGVQITTQGAETLAACRVEVK